MKRSRVQSLTALASVTLLMILLGSPAQAAPWQLDSWNFVAEWAEVVRSWLTDTPATEGSKSAGTTKRRTIGTDGTGKDGRGGVRSQADTGVCTDPNGVPCPGT